MGLASDQTVALDDGTMARKRPELPRYTEAHDDPVGIGTDLDRPPRCLGHDRVTVAVEADQAGAGHGMGGLVYA